jgi:hypothetical protein
MIYDNVIAFIFILHLCLTIKHPISRLFSYVFACGLFVSIFHLNAYTLKNKNK